MGIRIRRAYDPPAADHGYRVLVDRLWPRGLKREAAQIDAWLKDLAPSAELRRWFGHDPAKWREFGEAYRRELATPRCQPLLQELRERAQTGTVTLVYAAADADHNNAVVLRDVLAVGL